MKLLLKSRLFWGITVFLLVKPLLAEPYLAIKTGNPCSSCHVNPAGGGQRTEFGGIYGQNILSQSPLQGESLGALLKLNDRVSIGGNARFSARHLELTDDSNLLEFLTDRVTLYGSLKVNKHVTLYLDQQVAPGGSLNREAWVKISQGQWYVKAGRFFQPFGWRIEDDTAFIREVTGVNFTANDNGIELGFDAPNWQHQLAITNGAGGGNEVDTGKAVSLRTSWIKNAGRIGISFSDNHTDFGDRSMYGVFAGLHWKSVSWLLEIDRIDDKNSGVAPDSEQTVFLVEANIAVTKGHNVKLTLEEHEVEEGVLTFDRSRLSLVWEYFPWSFTQFRTGIRSLQSDDNRFTETDELFLQAHAYF